MVGMSLDRLGGILTELFVGSPMRFWSGIHLFIALRPRSCGD